MQRAPLETRVRFRHQPTPQSKLRDLMSPSQNSQVPRTAPATEGSDRSDFDNAPAPIIPCVACGHPNTAARRFCGGCGAKLWHSCPRCQSPVPLPEAYCGSCGENLVARREETRTRAARQLADCRRWLAEHSYQRAVEMLQLLASNDNPLVAEWSQEARRLLPEARRLWDEARAQAAVALQAAEVSLAACDFAEAQRAVLEIPEPLRCPRAAALLQTAQQRLAEIEQQQSQWQAAEQRGDLPTALQAAQRLLQLLPEDRHLRHRYQTLRHRAQQAAAQRRDALCQAAQRAVARHDYAAAERALEQIDPDVRTPAVEELARTVQELAFLELDVRTSPYVDEVLPAVAARLAQLAPDDPRPQQWSAEMQRRRSAAGGIARWARPPEEPWIGASVEWLTACPLIAQGDGTDLAAIRQQPAAFALACGLALQGLGLADLDVALPQESGPSSPLRRVQALLRKKTHPSAWGLDIGSAALKAVRLENRDGAAVLTACVLLPLEAEPDTADADLLRGALARLQQQCDLTDGRLCVNLPGSRVLGRFLNIPATVEGRKLDELMRYEAGHCIPFPLSEVYWSYHIPAAEAPDRKVAAESLAESLPMRRVILQAAKQSHVQQRLELLHSVDLRPEIVQGDCVALHNFLAYALRIGDGGAAQTPDSGGPHPVAMAVDLGAQGTNIVFSWPGGVWFRSIGLGGNEFTQALVRELKLTWPQAEQLKRQPAKACFLSHWDRALQPTLAAWCGELRRTIELFHTTHRDERLRLKRIYCLGGGSALHGLLRYLRTGR
jgi:type IV pilus assembly protein PilM